MYRGLYQKGQPGDEATYIPASMVLSLLAIAGTGQIAIPPACPEEVPVHRARGRCCISPWCVVFVAVCMVVLTIIGLLVGISGDLRGMGIGAAAGLIVGVVVGTLLYFVLYEGGYGRCMLTKCRSACCVRDIQPLN